MPLTGMNSEKIKELEDMFLRGLPDDGASLSNRKLREEILNWENELYLAIRKRLFDQGIVIIGKGKGGTVRKAIQEADEPETIVPETSITSTVTCSDPFSDEASLYEPMLKVIRERWVLDQPFDNVLVENTARGGRRADGVWSRPDITVAAMTSYTYVPGRHFDIVTFEIKHHTGANVTAVYEALAHRRCATRSYVLESDSKVQLQKQCLARRRVMRRMLAR